MKPLPLIAEALKFAMLSHCILWLTNPQVLGQAVTVYVNSVTASEAAGEAVVELNLGGSTAVPLSFKWATVDGTAKAGVDYVAAHGVVTLDPGEKRKALYLPLLDNGRLDGSRRFQVRFSEPSAGAVLDVTNVFVTIRDNEVNGCVDPDFRPSVAITPRLFLGGFFVAPVPAARPQDAGKVWVSGGLNGVAKLNADGSPDRTFQLDDTLAFFISKVDIDTGFRYTHTVEPLLALRDGSLLVEEYSGRDPVCDLSSGTNRLVRILPDGQLDPTFKPSTNVSLAAEQGDGMIVVVAEDSSGAFSDLVPVTTVFRIGVDGRPDPTFKTAPISYGGTSRQFGRTPGALRVDSRGRVIVGGRFVDSLGDGVNPVIRLKPDGVVDPTFRPDLKHTYDSVDFFPRVADFIVDPLNRIWLLTASEFDPAHGEYGPGRLALLKEDGTREEEFRGPEGFVGDQHGSAIIADADGVLLVSRNFGSGLNGVFEVKADGSVRQITSGKSLFGDRTLAPGNCPLDSHPALARDEAGRIFVASAASGASQYDDQAFSPGLVRLDRDATERRQFQLEYPNYPAPDLQYTFRGINGPFGFGESWPVAHIRLFRTGDTSAAAGVDYTTVDDTALAIRGDYQATSGHVSFAPQDVEREIQVPLWDNTWANGDRQFRIALRQPSDGYRVPAVHAPFTIRDDEFGFPPGSVRRLADGRVRLTLSNPVDGQNYSLQASADLQHWTPLATNSACCGRPLTLTFEDTNAPAALRFYRAIPRW